MPRLQIRTLQEFATTLDDGQHIVPLLRRIFSRLANDPRYIAAEA